MTTASCPRNNDTALHCEHGCCGNSSDQKCCTFELSETVIIVTCVVGALVVFIAVILLVLCITKKKKDVVTRIQPRRRPQQAHQVERRRQPTAEMPKPPPYSEAPPEYNSWNHINGRTTMVPTRDNTEYERPLALRSGQGRNITHSPQPSTSGGTPISINSNDITNYQVNTRIEARLNNDNENLRQHERNNNQNEQRNGQLSQDDCRKIGKGQLNPSGNISSRDTRQESAPSMERPVRVLNTTRSSIVHAPGYKDKKVNGIELPGIVGTLPESPRPTNQAAARRSAKRQAVLQHLESRRMRQLDMSLSSSYDEA